MTVALRHVGLGGAYISYSLAHSFISAEISFFVTASSFASENWYRDDPHSRFWKTHHYIDAVLNSRYR